MEISLNLGNFYYSYYINNKYIKYHLLIRISLYAIVKYMKTLEL